jgi:hypothetical protein
MTSFAESPDAPFAAEGGLRAPSPVDGDPYQALDDLMTVVEALCPVWPPRELPKPGGSMLL